MFSSKSFTVFALIFRSITHFELVFICGRRQRSKFILLYVNMRLSQHKLFKRRLFPPLNCLGTLESQLAINVRVDFQILSSSPLISMSILCQYHSVLINYCSFVVSFEIGNCESSLFFSSKTVLTILGPLHSNINFRISLSVSAKQIAGILEDIVWNQFVQCFVRS